MPTTLQGWAEDIQRYALHPAVRAAALDLAYNILHDHRWTNSLTIAQDPRNHALHTAPSAAWND